MSDALGTSENSSVSFGKGPSRDSLGIRGRATVEMYEGEDRLFTADNGSTHTLSALLDMGTVAAASIFKEIGQGFRYQAENIEAGFVQYLGLWVRPANLVEIRNQPNLVLTNGTATVAERMTMQLTDVSTTVPKNPTGITVGTGVTGPAVGNTDIETVCTGTTPFLAFDGTYPSRSGSVVTWKTTFGTAAVNSQAITEAVMVSAAAAGDAISRITFTAINKGTNDTLAVQFEWTFA